MKKIAIIYSGGKYWGGIETYLMNLFKYADKEKIDLTLLSIGNWELTRKLQISDLRLKIFSGKRVRVSTINEISEYIKHNDISLIVSMGVVSNFYGRLASKKANIPNLVIVHSDIDLDYPKTIKRIPFKISDRALRNVTKKYITVSGYLKQKLIKAGIPGSKIEVIYNGVDTLQIPNDTCPNGSFRREFQMTNKNQKSKIKNQKLIMVGSIGRLHKVKGYDNLIKAMKYLPSDTKLVIFGEGEERGKLESVVKSLDLGNRVSLPGFFSSEKALSEIDIYVQPSLSEGFGLTVVEAMMRGLPVVVTPAGSLVEIIQDGKTGLMAKTSGPKDIADSINKLINNAKLREELGSAAKEFAIKEFDVKKWAEKVTKVFLETAHQRRVN